MQGLFYGIAFLGIAMIGLMVMVGKLTPKDAIDRILWLVVVLIAADFALAMLDHFVIVPLIAAIKQIVPIALIILCIFAGLLVLVLIGSALLTRPRNGSPRNSE